MKYTYLSKQGGLYLIVFYFKKKFNDRKKQLLPRGKVTSQKTIYKKK